MIKRRFALGLAVAPALLLLAACGGSDSKNDTSQPAPAATTARTNAGADVPPTNTVGGGQLGSATPSPTATSSAVAKLNLNTATGADYKRVIPNFPDRFVNEFLEYRPYVSITQFRKEIGKYNVGQAQLTEWEKYVFVPVKPNDSDAETLKQIPGVTDSIAGQLTAARPYANNDAFLTKLQQLVPGVDVNQAKAFLG